MRPSPKFQAFIEQLAAKHGVDLVQPGASLKLTMPGREDWLEISTGDGRHVSVSRCFEDEGGPDADPYLLLLMDYPLGWLPLDLLYSTSEWERFVQTTGPVDDPEAVELATVTEYWATVFAAQGWLERASKMTQDTLILACDCPESGGECGTWLELTTDGFLALEDKDGLRVSILLPEGVEAALRTALLEFQQTNQAVSDEEADDAQPPDAATLWKWVDEYGKCTATDGCWCDPEGTCEHGHPSWLVVLGLV